MLINNKIEEVSDIDQKLQFEYVYDYLLSLGYVNYEFSSFAKPGYECKNNVTYWNRGKYIGLGSRWYWLKSPRPPSRFSCLLSQLLPIKRFIMNQ